MFESYQKEETGTTRRSLKIEYDRNIVIFLYLKPYKIGVFQCRNLTQEALSIFRWYNHNCFCIIVAKYINKNVPV